MHLLALISFLEPDTSWLLRTDVLLGIVTLLFVAVVLFATLRGLICKLCAKQKELTKGDKATVLSRFGISPSDAEDQPDERELHPGQLPTRRSSKSTHTR